ncbi:hypothetical protein [Euryhalocaulis caribicus]|uniref:hypothetical protein n=1 Tax=Euryhalocaulis caribicus TaxID=1161401 RepID=UPI0003AB0A34|nr:hypothetical protein [Euryhalocaulis caribicus]
MAELFTQILHMVVMIALSIIGVEYEPSRDENEPRRVEASVMLSPALYAIPQGRSAEFEFVVNGCDSRPAAVKSYDAEKPLFIGVTGYQS